MESNLKAEHKKELQSLHTTIRTMKQELTLINAGKENLTNISNELVKLKAEKQ
jgi:hypothetical protein